MPSGESSGSDSPPRRPRRPQTARRGRPFNRGAHLAREAIHSLLRDDVADAITMALRVVAQIIRVYSGIPGQEHLARALIVIHALLSDLRDAFSPVWGSGSIGNSIPRQGVDSRGYHPTSRIRACQVEHSGKIPNVHLASIKASAARSLNENSLIAHVPYRINAQRALKYPIHTRPATHT